MKKLALITGLILVFGNVFSQEDDFDRTSFKGEVSSQITVVNNEMAGTVKETEVETLIVFDSKSILINDEVYNIVNKEFDGIDLNTFLCTKRGSNYTITYIVDDNISIFDNSNPDIITSYQELLE
jgi:hypothetical protein